MADKTLTPRQERFVQEYLVDLNATQAAIRAGYSPKAANREGCRLLTNVDILSAITVAKQARAARAELSQDWVLRRLRIEATRREEGASHSARVNALKLLGQHMGMFKEKLELSGSLNGAVQHEHRASLEAADLASALALASEAGLAVSPDGGAKPVDTACSPRPPETVPAPG